MDNKKGGVFLSKQGDFNTPRQTTEFKMLIMMHKIATILVSFFLLATPAYAGSSFQYSKPIQTNNLAGYKFIVLDKDVYTHSNQPQLQDVRIFDDKEQEVPYFQDSSIATTTTPYSTIQDGNDTVITIAVNHLNGFGLELHSDDTFERNYVLYGMSGQTKWYLTEGTLVNRPLEPSLPKKDINWASTNRFDELKLIIHNRDNLPIDLNSVRFSYYLDRLVFKDLGNSYYRLAYGNTAAGSPYYDVTDYKTIITKEPLTQATLGTEVSTQPLPQPPDNQKNFKPLFTTAISALALLITGIGLSLRKKQR
ncbi:DUF3999 family protein [Desulfosporosinus sp. BG]|uniref:DUF3999 family protein n=1 Tax=Desulfosporosinus sp. BG TaxID=1633135 RepID=UPI00083BA025|nr:DUF3999 family protein [Desulfosporosinus sp. BG]ODA38910.1 hypothetical protein DSBG_4309 [Desulfosporosinus sp. BG]